jgi:glycerol uptake facilitator-like aquaporin
MIAMLIPYRETKEQTIATNEALDNISNLPAAFALLGFHELYTLSMYKALLIEYLGTASFVYIHVAIISACQSFTYPPLMIGIAHGILLCLFIYQFAMSSGAHFNSMITMSSILTGHIPALRGVLYVGVQIFGAATGAAIMRESIPAASAVAVGLGRCSMGSLEPKQALAIEFFFSIALLYPVYGTAFNLRQREIYGPVIPPVLIGLTLSLVIFASASLAPPPFTGAGANPSMCLGTAWAFFQSDLPDSDAALDYQWIYWVGPMLACVVNAVVYLLAPPHHEASGAEGGGARLDGAGGGDLTKES